MRLPKFEYFEPKTVKEACSLHLQYKDKARFMAGGTDVVTKMKRRDITPQYIIGLKAIPHLNYIEHDGAQGLRIGALTALDEIETSPLVRDRFSILAEAINLMASPSIRSLATIGGNLCNAVPSADSAPPLIVMGARVKLVNPIRERVVPLEEFFVGPGETVLDDDEMMVEIQAPDLPAHSGGVYIKHTLRRHLDLAMVGVAVMVTLDKAGEVCQDIKIALGAVSPTPIRAGEAEGMLKGKKFDEKLIGQAAQAAAEICCPISDIRSSEWYRKDMVKVLTGRAVGRAWDKAKSA